MSSQRAAGRNHIRFTSNVLRSAGIANDALCFILAYVLSAILHNAFVGTYYSNDLHVTGAVMLSINFFLIRISRDAYGVFKGQGEDLSQGTMLDFVVAATLTGLMVIQFGVAKDYSRALVTFYIVSSLGLLFLSRMAFRKAIWWLMDRGHIGQRVAIYGADRDVAERVLQLIEIERLPHLKISGFADNRKSRTDTTMIGTVPFIGGFDELLALAQNDKLDQIIIALPHVSQARLDSIVYQLSAAAIDVCIMPRELLELRTTYRLNFVGSLPVYTVWQQPVRDLNGVLKEIQDRILAFFGLLILSPLLILTAIAIKLESRGPIFFVQRRFGFNNLEIGIYKFRSMYVDKQDASGAERTTKNDARVTRVGRFIRRFSIDELPQLYNVLIGEMSLVGPRPHATEMRVGEKYYFDAVEGYAARHRVKPGITGLAQVRGLRGEIATVERAKRRVEYDVYYIENWSPFFDMRIILETIVKVIWDRDAY